jgi:hypothetical protein
MYPQPTPDSGIKSESHSDRSLRQRTKHQRRLTDDESLEAYEMPKPKGMWWRTFYRLQERAHAAENRAADDFIIAARRLLKMGEILKSCSSLFRIYRKSLNYRYLGRLNIKTWMSIITVL